jgi:hypothetical protein
MSGWGQGVRVRLKKTAGLVVGDDAEVLERPVPVSAVR